VPLLLVVAFVVVPIVELYVIVQVGQAIGVLPTIALLVLDSVLGAWLVRREGRRTWAAFRTALQSSRVPAKEVADGALVVFGGALLLTPGFTTDVLGLVCVAPPTRAVLRRALTGIVTRRLGVVGVVGRAAARGTTRSGAPYGRGGAVVEGEVVDGPAVGPVDGPVDGAADGGPESR
jgi:UPF0716 protein FxsA